MSRTDRSSSRRAAPALEALEARDLPSTVARPSSGGRHARPADAGGVQVGGGPAGQAAPSAQSRRSFFAAFTGPYSVGRGHDASEALRTFLKGNGTSNKFLKGNLKLALSTPADPTQPTLGTATLFDQNFPQTGNQLILDLEGPPSADGRPTSLTWSVGEGSSGAFTNASGQGTLELRFHPAGRRPRPAISAGDAGVQFRGELVADPTVNSRGAMEGLGLPH